MDSAKRTSYNAIFVTFKFYAVDSELNVDIDLNAFRTTGLLCPVYNAGIQVLIQSFNNNPR